MPIEISIVVATYDRPLQLVRCLRSLIFQKVTRGFEIIVVDNHPQSGLSSSLATQFADVHWLRETAPGLSRARNFGIAAALGAVVVTTDDDVIAPAGWIEILTAPLFEAGTDLVATTGNCLPWKVETKAEALFEAYGGLRHGSERIHFDSQWLARWRICFPQIWRIGTTANAAFRASLFRKSEIGMFETRLGTGTPTGAWEDLYCFYRILKAGHRIAYIPKAEVFHTHRESERDLARQLQGYRRGEVAFLILILLRHRDWRALGQMFVWIPWWRSALLYKELRLRLNGGRKFSLRILWVESLAYFAGPLSLWRADRASRRIDQPNTRYPTTWQPPR